MGLDGYRSFKDQYVDEGKENLVILDDIFNPDFFNRNTIQVWDVSASVYPKVKKWIGATLTNRTLHEISVVNNSASEKRVNFDDNYHLIDESFEVESDLVIGPYGTAHFYCTAILVDNNLIFSMRTGSQDDRKVVQ